MGEYNRLYVLEEEEQGKAEQKRPYEKPSMTAVRLFADEVLGGGCIKNVPLPTVCNPATS